MEWRWDSLPEKTCGLLESSLEKCLPEFQEIGLSSFLLGAMKMRYFPMANDSLRQKIFAKFVEFYGKPPQHEQQQEQQQPQHDKKSSSLGLCNILYSFGRFSLAASQDLPDEVKEAAMYSLQQYANKMDGKELSNAFYG
jgi:hypothetical protein